jgi:hypothetical protein
MCVLSFLEIKKGAGFLSQFANKFGGCVSRLSGGACLTCMITRRSKTEYLAISQARARTTATQTANLVAGTLQTNDRVFFSLF